MEILPTYKPCKPGDERESENEKKKKYKAKTSLYEIPD